ncbi:MAG: hypothetical protein AABW83_04185 [Nanoarchaeota archaeon]
MKSLIIGYGEIGKALYNILEKEYPTYWSDKDKEEKEDKFEIIHICFPYSEFFIEDVKKYQEFYKPKYTIIHSTVPPGISRKLNAIHSPIIGLHPHLETSLKIFTKFIGGKNASDIADYFRRSGIKVYLFDDPETTELMKILDTSFYGLCIEYVKEVKKLCEKNNVPFEAWTIWTQNYNEGYKKLGFPEYNRPNLNPIMKRIGGHCVSPNLRLIDTKFHKFLIGLESSEDSL